MTVITLPPEVDGALSAEARIRGTTPELLAIETLRKEFVAADSDAAEIKSKPGQSLYDSLKHLIGSVQGSGESVSDRTGEVFTEIVVEKHRRGEL